MAEELERAGYRQLPADPLQLEGILADQARPPLGELSLAACSTVAFAQTDQALIRVDPDDNPRKAGMSAESVAERGLNGDERGSPADIRDLHGKSIPPC